MKTKILTGIPLFGEKISSMALYSIVGTFLLFIVCVLTISLRIQNISDVFSFFKNVLLFFLLVGIKELFQNDNNFSVRTSHEDAKGYFTSTSDDAILIDRLEHGYALAEKFYQDSIDVSFDIHAQSCQCYNAGIYHDNERGEVISISPHLISYLSTGQIAALILHEYAHHQHRDVILETIRYWLVILALVYPPVAVALFFFNLMISKMVEFAADDFSAAFAGKDRTIGVLKNLIMKDMTVLEFEKKYYGKFNKETLFLIFDGHPLTQKRIDILHRHHT